MRALLVLAVLATLAGMAWFLTAGPDPGSPMPGPDGSIAGGRSGRDLPPGDALVAERSPVPRASAETNPVETAPPPGATAAAEPEAAPDKTEGTAAGRTVPLAVTVFDAATRKPVAAFRYVLLHADGERQAEPVDGHEASLRCAPGTTVSLTVEAETYEPSPPHRIDIPASRPPPSARFDLQRAMARSGVELWIQAPDAAPVPWVEVEALVASETPGAAPRSLWRRRAKDARGVYALPDLRPGSYRLRLQAITAEGEIATHLGHEEEFAFSGTERIVRNIQLRPGCLVDLEVTDPAGQALGEEVALRVLGSDGTPIETRWVATVDGRAVERVNGLPARARARLVEPLPPRAYVLELRRGQGPVHRRDLVLTAGVVQTVRVTLP